jgi:hypothetical protein
LTHQRNTFSRIAVSVVFSWRRQAAVRELLFPARSVTASIWSSVAVSSSSSILTICSDLHVNQRSILPVQKLHRRQTHENASPTYRCGRPRRAEFLFQHFTVLGFSFMPSTLTSSPRRAFWNEARTKTHKDTDNFLHGRHELLQTTQI